jgi:hypothetical protein
MSFSLGTARAKPGRLTYGAYDLVAHPTGGMDRIPVVLAQGDSRGPVFWMTAGIHGPEHAGLQVLHLLLTRDLVKELYGTLVCLPALNPAGLRTMTRQAYYHDGDPNRLFPDGKPKRKLDPDMEPPSSLELAYTRLFAEIKATADYMIDLHNAWTNSISFVFRDRVFYRDDGPAAPPAPPPKNWTRGWPRCARPMGIRLSTRWAWIATCRRNCTVPPPPPPSTWPTSPP